MIVAENWDSLYYALIKIKGNKSIEVLGVGSTKMLCRKAALETELNNRALVSEEIIHTIETIDVGQLHKKCVKSSTYTMVYAEAKIYIYGKRYGFDRMLVVYDPTYREDLIRFAGFKKKS